MKLVKAFAPWCTPCKSLGATLHGVNHPLVETMEELNIDAEVERAVKYGIRSIPTMVIVDDEDNVVRSLNGNQPKAKILEFLA
jgi:thioredoxin 1